MASGYLNSTEKQLLTQLRNAAIYSLQNDTGANAALIEHTLDQIEGLTQQLSRTRSSRKKNSAVDAFTSSLDSLYASSATPQQRQAQQVRQARAYQQQQQQALRTRGVKPANYVPLGDIQRQLEGSMTDSISTSNRKQAERNIRMRKFSHVLRNDPDNYHELHELTPSYEKEILLNNARKKYRKDKEKQGIYVARGTEDVDVRQFNTKKVRHMKQTINQYLADVATDPYNINSNWGMPDNAKYDPAEQELREELSKMKSAAEILQHKGGYK